MGMAVTGITPASTIQQPAMNRPPDASQTAAADFGPAVVFTPSAFDQAVNIQMYNAAGNAVALTHWLRTGSIAPPGAAILSNTI